MMLDRLRDAARRVTEGLREEFGRPAMNRRILHRLATTQAHELARLGLTSRDVSEAAAPGVSDAAAFLRAKRVTRRGAGELSSRGASIEFCLPESRIPSSDAAFRGSASPRLR